MTFQDYSSRSRKLIEEKLKNFFVSNKGENIPQVFKRQKALEVLEEFVLKGKLIRGTLFLLSVELLGEKITEKHVAIAVAIELVHSALLIQDDIIDNDFKRRGGKTVFALYEEEGKKIKANSPYHYGISIAIIVSDVAFFLAFELLASYNEPELSQILNFYSHEIYLVALAEGIDSEFGQTPTEPDESDIYSVYHYKTARYTFSLPFVMAGIAAKSEDKIIRKLEKIGEAAGIIFQIKDDIIGLFGNEEVIGKPVGSDIREDKKTLIRAMLYKNVNSSEMELLKQTFGNAEISDKQIESIRELARKHLIEDALDKKINDIMNEVWENFKMLDAREEYKLILKDLLVYNLRRNY